MALEFHIYGTRVSYLGNWSFFCMKLESQWGDCCKSQQSHNLACKIV